MWQKSAWRRHATGAIVAPLSIAALASAAEAAPKYPMSADQTVRTAPKTSAADMGSVRDGEVVELVCQDRGTSVRGSTLWNYIQYSVDGTNGKVKRGWVPDYYVKTGQTGPVSGVQQGDCPAVQKTPGAPLPPPPPPVDPCATTPVANDLVVSAGISPSGGGAITTRGSRDVGVTGRLTTSAGAPVPSAQLCVAARNATPGAPLRKGASVTTDAQGGFSYVLSGGPSQRLWFIYSTSHGAASASVLVERRARVGFHSSRASVRNGERVTLSGRLKGRPRRRGVLVEVQAQRGPRWQTFGTVRTRAGGRFSFPYRFKGTTGVQRYALRARVADQASYPYAAGASRAAHVRVTG